MSDENRKTKDLAGGVLVYGIGNFGSKILMFLIVPLYTFFISTEDMGEYDLIITTVNLLSPIVTMQIADAAYRWLIRDTGDKELYIRLTLQILIFNFLVAMLCVFAVYFFHPFRYLWYFIFVLIAGRTLETVQKLLRGIKKQKMFAVSGIIYTALFLASNVILICVLRRGVESLFQSMIFAYAITIVFILLAEKQLRVNLFKKPDIPVIKKLLKFSIPLIPNQLNWWVMNSSDRYIIKIFLGSSFNGIYAVSYKFPTVLQVILNLFTTSWQDLFVGDKDKGEDTGRYYGKVFEKFYIFSFSFLWVLVPASRIFISLFTAAAYHDAAKYISFLYLGTVFQSFSSFYGAGYLRDKNTKQASLTSIYGAIVNAAVNIACISFIGLYAACISTFLGFFVMWLIREHQNREALGISIDRKKFGLLFAGTLLICAAECFGGFIVDIPIFIAGAAMFTMLNLNLIKAVFAKVAEKGGKKS